MSVRLGAREWRLEAHAIVSREGHIADAEGHMPEGLVNPFDQARFQGMLDRACLAVLGSEGHHRHPQRSGRRRLVVTSQVDGLERDGDAVWRWNPDGATHFEALADAAPNGGTVAVTGGARVFEHFLKIGLDRFDLAVSHRCEIPDGRPCLPDVPDIEGLTQRLEAARLGLETIEWLDPATRVELRRYRK